MTAPTRRDPPAFAAAAPRIRAIAASGESKVPRELIAQLPALEIISVFGVGYDGVDVAAARERGIAVTHTPNVLNDEVADLAIALVLAVSRRIAAGRPLRARRRSGRNGPMPLARKVSGARLGIVGLGRIGKAIAKRAEAFDMSIAYTVAQRRSRTRPTATSRAPRRSPPRSTSSSSSRRAAPATRKLIDAEVLAALGPQGYLINVARGSVVDETALVEALQRRHDRRRRPRRVRERAERAGARCCALDNVVLTPHVGSATWQTRQAMADLAFGNLQAHFAGQPLLSPVP